MDFAFCVGLRADDLGAHGFWTKTAHVERQPPPQDFRGRAEELFHSLTLPFTSQPRTLSRRLQKEFKIIGVLLNVYAKLCPDDWPNKANAG
jgi:hypothetical protein